MLTTETAEPRKRKCIVIIETWLGRVKDVHLVGSTEKMKKELPKWIRLTQKKERKMIQEMNTGKLIRFEGLPGDTGIVIKKTWH